jgi:hypothetical protein
MAKRKIITIMKVKLLRIGFAINNNDHDARRPGRPCYKIQQSKEAAENSIEQSSGDEYPATKPVEEVAGQRDTKSADAADSSDSMIV